MNIYGKYNFRAGTSWEELKDQTDRDTTPFPLLETSEQVQRVRGTTVVLENKVTFICELIPERYIYLRNTQNQLKITKICWKQKFCVVCVFNFCSSGLLLFFLNYTY